MSATFETFEKPETKDKYNLFLINILLINNLIADLKNTIVERIKAMDNIADGKIPDDLVFMIAWHWTCLYVREKLKSC